MPVIKIFDNGLPITQIVVQTVVIFITHFFYQGQRITVTSTD